MRPRRYPRLPSPVEERLKGRITFAITAAPRGVGNLDAFCRAVRDGREPYPHLLYVVRGLERILAGESAQIAFELTGGKGNKRTRDREERDQAIFAEVSELKREWGRGKSDEALHVVSRRYHLSLESVRKIYTSRRGPAEWAERHRQDMERSLNKKSRKAKR
jgi:hypothetical protein